MEARLCLERKEQTQTWTSEPTPALFSPSNAASMLAFPCSWLGIPKDLRAPALTPCRDYMQNTCERWYSVTSKAQCISPGALPNAGSQLPNSTTVRSHQTQHPSTWASSGRRCSPVAIVHHVVAKRARAVHSTSICKTECASQCRGIRRIRGADKRTLPGTLDARPMQIVRGETEPAGEPSSSCGTSTCRAAVSPAENPSIMLDARPLCPSSVRVQRSVPG